METIKQKTPQCCGMLEKLHAVGKRKVIDRPITYGDTPQDLILLPFILVVSGQRYFMNFCPFCGARISKHEDSFPSRPGETKG